MSADVARSSVSLLDVPLTHPRAAELITHECGHCGAPLRLSTVENWRRHWCGEDAGGRRVASLAVFYESEDDMRWGEPRMLDAAQAQLVMWAVKNRKPLPAPPPLPFVDEDEARGSS